ncbi:MAG: hypothetical protein VX223_07715 [Myxococcota bacterium]|nr:hypothetical protein [Myxococcota bacterium]
MKYTSGQSLLLACVFWLSPLVASAAPPGEAANATAETPAYGSLLEYNTARKTRDVNVMWALGGWAAANVISGAIGWPLENDERWKAFHGMNVAWGAINLAIAIGVGIKAHGDEPEKYDLRASLERAHTAQKAYLLNLGLDVAYLTAGALMWERGASGNKPMIEGYGWSLVMQGGVLLFFDAVMYALDNRDNGFLYGQIQPATASSPPRWEIGYATRF